MFQALSMVPPENLLRVRNSSQHLKARENKKHFPETSLFLDALFRNLRCDFSAVSSVIDPILTCRNRCQVTPMYVHGVITDNAIFLVSNATGSLALTVTDVGACWSLGESGKCSVQLSHPTVERCHAVITYGDQQGFGLTDTGSERGTFLNNRRISARERVTLRNGDLIALGKLQIEFFVDNFQDKSFEDSYAGGDVESFGQRTYF
jgi:FHA domain